jgi:hypothetical protein
LETTSTTGEDYYCHQYLCRGGDQIDRRVRVRLERRVTESEHTIRTMELPPLVRLTRATRWVVSFLPKMTDRLPVERKGLKLSCFTPEFLFTHLVSSILSFCHLLLPLSSRSFIVVGILRGMSPHSWRLILFASDEWHEGTVSFFHWDLAIELCGEINELLWLQLFWSTSTVSNREDELLSEKEP